MLFVESQGTIEQGETVTMGYKNHWEHTPMPALSYVILGTHSICAVLVLILVGFGCWRLWTCRCHRWNGTYELLLMLLCASMAVLIVVTQVLTMYDTTLDLLRAVTGRLVKDMCHNESSYRPYAIMRVATGRLVQHVYTETSSKFKYWCALV